jgi:hypothetical protein
MPDGSRFNWIETDAGTIVSGSSIRLKGRRDDDVR